MIRGNSTKANPSFQPKGNHWSDTLFCFISGHEQGKQSMVPGATIDAMQLLTMGFAHEINNVNACIRVNAQNIGKIIELLEIDEPPGSDGQPVQRVSGNPDRRELYSQARRVSAGILEATLRLEDFTEHLKQFGSSRCHAELTTVDLNSVVDAVLSIARGYVEHVATITWQSPRQPITIDGTCFELEQAVLNILKNACLAVQTRIDDEVGDFAGEISIQVDQTGDCATLRIQDNGCGMSQETLEKISMPYFTTRPEGEGTGLGMSIVLGVAQRHSGKLEMSSDLNAGTTISISFPASKAQSNRSD